jgi:hypothetical protein
MRTTTKSRLSYDDIALAKTLNPATATRLSPATDIRAEARLQQIVAAGRQAGPKQAAAALRVPTLAGPTLLGPKSAARRASTAGSQAPRSRAIRWIAIPIAATAVIGIVVALPAGVGSAPAQASMLSWTAHFQPLTDAELAAADTLCAASINQSIARNNADTWPAEDGSAPLPAPSVEAAAVAERRGDWGLLGYPQGDFLATCLVWLAPDGPHVAMRHDSASGFTDPMLTGSSGLANARMQGFDVARLPATPAGGVDLRTNVEVTVPDDAAAIPPDGNTFTMAGGRAGEASVANGWWLAWWPGAMGGPDTYTVFNFTGPRGWTRDGTPIDDDADPVVMQTNPGNALISGYTATLADGSSISVAQSWENCLVLFGEFENASGHGRCFLNQFEAQSQYDEWRQAAGVE